MSHVNDLPPSYSQATGSKPGDKPRPTDSSIPSEHRRSMEDEVRQLPPGWVRTYDPNNSHQFFVDTTCDPPRSIWHHPYDDEQYLSTLPSAERERIESLQKQTTKNDLVSMDTEQHDHTGPSTTAELPPRLDKGKSKQSYGRRLKDKLTGTTHEQREQERQQKAQAENEAYRQNLHMQQAMTAAETTGQPQFLGKDRYGHDVYLEPSYGARPAYMQQGQLVNPYSNGVYQNPNARFIRPGNPSNHPYGYGYGGGMGMPIAGGLLGGMLLGGLLF